MSPVFLLAGRRPDAPDADTPRFPIANALAVREKIRALVIERKPIALICSAACGADLLALDVAGDLGVTRHIILPFPAEAFRESSVTDRPGQWGALFDRLVQEVELSGELTVLGEEVGDEGSYAAANEHMLALALERRSPLIAVAVWEGSEREGHDLTAHMIESACQAGADVAEVLTR